MLRSLVGSEMCIRDRCTCLAPMLDMLNHHDLGPMIDNVHFSVAEQHAGTQPLPLSRQYVGFYTTMETPAGGQLFSSYGRHCMEVSFAVWGFASDNSSPRLNFTDVALAHVKRPPSYKAGGVRSRLLEDIWKCERTCESPAFINGGPSKWAALEHLVQCARWLVVPAGQLAAVHQQGSDLAVATWLRRPLRHELEVEALKLVSVLLSEALDYGSSEAKECEEPGQCGTVDDGGLTGLTMQVNADRPEEQLLWRLRLAEHSFLQRHLAEVEDRLVAIHVDRIPAVEVDPGTHVSNP
eukprot:TRINITY_DN24992_c0_g1_i1.p1 TRINITY_DN24992_c0_g1~~TRINITY_DN24992_c0_g1_i1.p1  ORF type:complete len:325 (+),score=81.41 TRINITY_DN24992_c0_g1_i1:93-977(+)